MLEERLTLADRAVGRFPLILFNRLVNLATTFGLLATSVRYYGCSSFLFSTVLRSVGKVVPSLFVAVIGVCIGEDEKGSL